MTKILGTSYKIEKSNHSNRGYLSCIVYLSPASESGWQMCPFRTPACEHICLGHSSGLMPMPASKRARIARTTLLMTNRGAFGIQIEKEIRAFIRKAAKLGLVPAIRLNGDSDIRWDLMKFDGQTLMEKFPEVVWYDYTKWPIHLRPDNNGIHLTFSRSENTTMEEIKRTIAAGRNVAVVFDVVPTSWEGFDVINGDSDDLRPLDPVGVIVGLEPKGPLAKRDRSGFVVRLHSGA